MTANVLFLGADLARRHQPWTLLDLDAGETGAVIVAPEAPCPNATIPVHVIEDYYGYSAIGELAWDLHAERPFTHVVALSEDDVELAGVLNEHFALPGAPRWRHVQTGRDKETMKRLWDLHAVPTARHGILREAADLRDLARRIGYPLVVKPRAAAGSVGVAVLRDDAERRAWLAEHWRRPLLSAQEPAWMAEEYIVGALLQVDGIVLGRELEVAWPSRVSNLLDWTSPLTITTCAPQDPVVPAARALVDDAIRALSPRPAVSVFHAELFEQPDGSLRMSEIGWRVGGMLTAHMVKAAFGVDPVERYLTALIHPELLDQQKVPDLPLRMAGQVGIGYRAGVIDQVRPIPPEMREAAGVFHDEYPAAPGASHPAAYSSDVAAKAVVAGDDLDSVRAGQAKVADYFASEAITYRAPAPLAGPPAGCVR
jgi:biotin carboxylase